MSRRRVIAGSVAASVAGTGVLGTAAGLSIASYFARQVLSPKPPLPDVEIVGYDDRTVTLTRTMASEAPGRYSLYWDGRDSHARLGEVLERAGGHVVRELLGVDFGELHEGPGRFTGYFYAGPPATTLPLPIEDVSIDGPLGEYPAWIVRAPQSRANRWAVLVHGRAAARAETLRAVRPLTDVGWTCLCPSYRNDQDAPADPAGRYGLGLTEWRDVEAAVAYAYAQGASEVMLTGWSMGGAVCLQLLDLSTYAEGISRVVLDAPVVDWQETIDFHARLNRVPMPLNRLAQRAVASPAVHGHFAGLSEPLDLPATNWVRRAAELRTPTLIIHSEDDDFVPYGPSAALATARPDLVRLEPWRVALHCREWNTEPDRWESVVREFAS